MSWAPPDWHERHRPFEAVFDQGFGLRAGMTVTVAGRVVGEVRSVGLTPDHRVRVLLDVRDRHADHVVEGTYAVSLLTSEGKVIELAPGTGAPLPPGATLPTRGTADPLVALSRTDLPQLVERLATVLADIEVLARQLDLGEGQLPVVIDRIAALTEAAERAQRRVLDDGGTLERTERVLDASLSLTTELSAATAEFRTTNAALQQTTRAISASTENVDGTLARLPTTLARLDTALDELAITLDAMQRLPLLKGKVKQAEREQGERTP